MEAAKAVSRSNLAHEVSSSRTCYFLKLPLEMRLCIYDMVFESLAHHASQDEIRYASAILFTNREILNEIWSVFRRYYHRLCNSNEEAIEAARKVYLATRKKKAIEKHLRKLEYESDARKELRRRMNLSIVHWHQITRGGKD